MEEEFVNDTGLSLWALMSNPDQLKALGLSRNQINVARRNFAKTGKKDLFRFWTEFLKANNITQTDLNNLRNVEPEPPEIQYASGRVPNTGTPRIITGNETSESAFADASASNRNFAKIAAVAASIGSFAAIKNQVLDPAYRKLEDGADYLSEAAGAHFDWLVEEVRRLGYLEDVSPELAYANHERHHDD